MQRERESLQLLYCFTALLQLPALTRIRRHELADFFPAFCLQLPLLYCFTALLLYYSLLISRRISADMSLRNAILQNRMKLQRMR